MSTADLDPISRACRLLREGAAELKNCHTPAATGHDWTGEPEAKAAYDEHMATADALERWADSIGAGGVESLRGRQCLHRISEPAGEYPALPEPDTRWRAQWAGHGVSFHSKDQIIGFANGRARAAVDADRAMRAAQPAGAQQPGAAYAALPEMPQFPAHPEPMVMDWSAIEISVIAQYGRDMYEAGKRASHGQAPAQAAPDVSGYVSEWASGICTADEAMAGIAKLYGAQAAPATQPAPQQEARPVTPYTCPKCHALWLHWPAEQSGFGVDTLNCRSATHCDYCEKGGVEQLERLERVPAALKAPQQEAQEPVGYTHASWIAEAKRGGGGSFVGRKNAAFDVPIYTAPQPSPQADSQPAPAREEEREAFKAAHRHLELDEVPDAWGRPMFKYSHVEASWLGWIASAARAPADSVTAPAGGAAVPADWPTDAMIEAGRKVAATHGRLLGSGQSLWHVFREMFAAAPTPPTPPTPPTQAADSVLEDAARYRWLRQHWFTMSSNYQGGITFKLGEPRWSDITEAELDAAIDAARKQGANHD